MKQNNDEDYSLDSGEEGQSDFGVGHSDEEFEGDRKRRRHERGDEKLPPLLAKVGKGLRV